MANRRSAQVLPILLRLASRCNGCHAFSVCLLLLLISCAEPPHRPPAEQLLVYQPSGNDQLARYAPVFVIHRPEQPYNRIGTPRATVDDTGRVQVFVSPDEPVMYGEERSWQGLRGTYTNYLYRVHFQEVPFSIWPFNLGAGKNVGLLVILTMDARQRPLLYTLVHTCGCYLAFLPTTLMAEAMLPENWPTGRQAVYGESLPAMVSFTSWPDSWQRLHLLLRDGSHRVVDGWQGPDGLPAASRQVIPLRPLPSLTRLPLVTGETVSFYETRSSRRDYVRNSEKIWERLFMSWWALDWRVGEDKRLGDGTEDGIVFYTSLKPWAREGSDLRDFARFLSYWGWRL